MKKLCKTFLAVLLIAAMVVALVSATATQDDYIDIPDPNFAAAVRREMGLPEGAPIPRAMAAELTELDLHNLNISNLAGIEYFVALEALDVSENQLNTLDVSNNPALEFLSAGANQLTTIDVSNNIALGVLVVSYNNLTQIDVSNNQQLAVLWVDDNNLTTLDVSNNQYLQWLSVSDNQLATLNISNNPALMMIHICNNNLTALYISAPSLEKLWARNNNLTTLDMSNAPLLGELWVNDNNLTALNVLNNSVLLWLDVSNNDLTTLDISNNPWTWFLNVSGNRIESLDYVIGWRTWPNFTFYPQQGEQYISSWAFGYVIRAMELGIVPLNFNRAFRMQTTRVAFTHLAVTLYETVTGHEITGRVAFIDTIDTNILKAAYIGVVQGVGDGRFDPLGTLTREQAATMLARLAYAIGSPLPEQAATFADNDAVSYWAIDAVGQVQAAGIMTGVGDNMFNPQGSYTREQSIVTMLRLFDFVN